MIVAQSAVAAHGPEPRALSMLVAEAGAVAAVAPDGTRKRLLEDARDATYSPDGTLVAFVRAGDLWLANADGSGQRVLARTPNVDEWGPAWLPNGQTIVYTASVNGARQIRLIELPLGPSHRIAASGEEALRRGDLVARRLGLGLAGSLGAVRGLGAIRGLGAV